MRNFGVGVVAWALLLLPVVAGAAPSVTSVTGTVSHGQTVTVSGSGFGQKATAAPLIWDNCSGTRVTDLWSGGWPNSGTASYQLAYRTPIRGVALPHSHVTKYLSGSYGDGASASAGYNVMLWKTLTNVAHPSTIYTSWYRQVDPNWSATKDGSDNNFKSFNFSNGSGPYTMNSSTDNNWYLDYQQAGSYPNTYIPWTSPGWESNDDGGSLSSHYWGAAGSNALGRWIKSEVELKIDSVSGYIKMWDNGNLVINYSGPTDKYIGTTKTIGIGGYSRKQDANSWLYLADLYFDTTPQRVMICNGSTWATRGGCEVQIPQSWSDNGSSAQTKVSVNQGAFPDKSSAYLYVVDANGNASSAVPVMFSSAGADTSAPGVSISSPLSGATVTGTTSVSATATDNVGVTKVEFYVNNVLQATDTATPYLYSWNTSALGAGTYTLTVKAYDAAGNVGSASVPVSMVKDTTPPSVSLTAPANGVTLSGTVDVTATATDNIGVTKVEFYDNGTLLSATNVAPYSYRWNTASVANGSHTLTAKAYDAAGNVATSSSIGVTVKNGTTDATPPTVSLTAPANGATVRGTVAVTASASDNAGVAKVEFYLNGALKSTATAAPYSYSFNTTSVANGTYTLTAKAYDAAGNVGQSGSVGVNVNNTQSTTSSTYTIWPATAVPGTVDSGPDSAVELGVKFRSDVNGSITGIRFYKASTNTGTHVGHLWSGTGTLLATATFTNETASGWQQVKFSNPVPITANTVYVASYYAPVAHFSVDRNYFTGKGMDRSPLHALASGVSGANGVFAYGSSSAFPNQSYADSNYWVDVIFTTGSSATTADTTRPTVTAFTLPSTSATLQVPITTFTASDNVGVTGYLVTESSTAPSATSAGWSASRPASYTFSSSGSKTLYAWVKDAAGNVSPGVSASVAVSVVTSIWPSSTTPSIADAGPDGGEELGLRFRSDVNGYITGIRFYKASTNTGTHVGNLWTSTGTLLARATFTNETASGWQQVTFPTPVAITANTVYVASYYNPAGHFSVDRNYFTGKGMDNGPLHALASGVSGANGVYAYAGSSVFPNQSYMDSNYWVDVVFRQ